MTTVSTRQYLTPNTSIILLLGQNEARDIVLTAGERLNTARGAVKPRSNVPKAYIRDAARGAFVLRPTPELLQLTLRHRTQIVYPFDSSVIISLLDLFPGDIVLESGTGSASLSRYFIRAIMPHGKLYSFDIDNDRIECAKETCSTDEDIKIGIFEQRDVMNLGFPSIIANAVFLDLPSPWQVISHPTNPPHLSVKSGGKIAILNASSEQVLKTREALSATSVWDDIHTYEALERNWLARETSQNMKISDVHFYPLPQSAFTSYLTVATRCYKLNEDQTDLVYKKCTDLE